MIKISNSQRDLIVRYLGVLCDMLKADNGCKSSNIRRLSKKTIASLKAKQPED
nr:MAG TPA: hypothetical protein [Caudoviricetes sp.]